MSRLSKQLKEVCSRSDFNGDSCEKRRKGTRFCYYCQAAAEIEAGEVGKNDVKNLKILVAQAYDIVDLELLPNVARMAIQDFGRLNQFMIDATPIKEEIDK